MLTHAPVLSKIAAMLAALHEIELPAELQRPGASAATMPANARDNAARILKLLLEVHRWQEQLLQQSAARLPRQEAGMSFTIIHGSFKLAQIRMRDAQLGLIDFAEPAVGDRLYDVAEFLALVINLRISESVAAAPITATAVHHVQEAFGITAETARQLIVLFRLAWICSSPDKPKYYSDLARKSLVVVPQPKTGRSQVQEHAEATLQQVVETLALTCQNNSARQRFRQRYSKVGITNMALVMSRPQPLFDLFVALPQEEDRFTFITCYRMGSDYFKAFAARAAANLQNRHLAAALHEAGYERRQQRLVYLRVGANDEGFYKHESRQPLAESRAQL